MVLGPEAGVDGACRSNRGDPVLPPWSLQQDGQERSGSKHRIVWALARISDVFSINNETNDFGKCECCNYGEGRGGKGRQEVERECLTTVNEQVAGRTQMN